MIRRPPRSTRVRSSAASDVYKRQVWCGTRGTFDCCCVHEPQIRLVTKVLPGSSRAGCAQAKEEAMEQIYERVAGCDVHRDQVTVCVRTPGHRGGVHKDKARFKTTTAGLIVMADWCGERAVELVAMVATGVYLNPVYYALEDRFRVWLCNAYHVKNVPGRKTDMSDADWLADVAAHGMVRPSFVPPVPIRELRELTRYRKKQIDTRASELARLEKVLQDAGIKLTSVAS